MMRAKKLPGTSYYKGRKKKPWYACIKANGKVSYLGYFRTEKQANRAFLKAAKERDRHSTKKPKTSKYIGKIFNMVW